MVAFRAKPILQIGSPQRLDCYPSAISLSNVSAFR